MTTEEAIKIIRNIHQTDEEKEALQNPHPELKESEDEKIRKEIIRYLESKVATADETELLYLKSWIAHLEKQKEPQELPLMNGDADLYFDNWNQHNDSSKRGCFNEGIRYAQRLQEEQKPVEPSDDELQRHHDELYDFKVFAAKQAREHHVSFVHDFEWNNFCGEILSYFNEKQQPVEWSEEQLSIIDYLIDLIDEHYKEPCTKGLLANGAQCFLRNLKSFRPHWKPSEEPLEVDYPYLLSLLLEAIDYSFLKIDGTYKTSLTYPVIDKVNYVKKQVALIKQLKK